MDIVVVAGGTSTERDVSLITGSRVAHALKRKGHRVILLDVFLGLNPSIADEVFADPDADIFDGRIEGIEEVGRIAETVPDLESVIRLRGLDPDEFFGPNVIRICQRADIVFIALHGQNGEDGKVQAAFDLYGIKYTGTGYLGSALAMDKTISRWMFAAAGVPVAKGFSMKRFLRSDAEPSCGFPCVVKPNCGGSSVGVSIAYNAEQYSAALDTAFNYEDTVVIEEYVKGREFSVGVIDGKALPVIEIAPKSGFYDYRNKYQEGAAVETCPADIPGDVSERMQRYAELAAKTLGLDVYSRSDFMMGEDGRIICLESNTLPGMTPTSLLPQEAAVIGMDYDDLCQRIVDVSLTKGTGAMDKEYK